MPFIRLFGFPIQISVLLMIVSVALLVWNNQTLQRQVSWLEQENKTLNNIDDKEAVQIVCLQRQALIGSSTSRCNED